MVIKITRNSKKVLIF